MALETESAPASPTHAPRPLGGRSPPRQSSTGPRPKHHSTSSASNSLRKNSISSGNLYERGARLISGSHNNLSSPSSLRPSSAESSPHALSAFSSPFSSSSSHTLNQHQQQLSLPALPVAVTFDMKNVLAMTEIKTEIGYARAWLRLSLEKKQLSVHLATLLSDAELLRNLYKRYAFLRCDDEKEQFLSYILSLNAVDYYCFTNTYTTTKLPYRVVLFTSRKMSAATTTANAWVSLAGSLGHTPKIPLTRTHQNQMVFQHKNLGLLSTLRLGHDNHGLSPKWLVEHVLVRNEVTGHTWRFPCGRWLGRGIDDGSLERVLVGEMVPHGLSADALLQSCRTPPRCRSPHPPGGMRKDLRLTVPEMQQLLGDAVNNLVKFFYKTEKERGSLTPLLCGDLGLVACLELVFGYGFKSSRFFGKNLYLWDYLERVEQEFSSWLREEREREQLSGLAREGASAGHARRRAVLLIDRINKRTTLLGKDDKFQLFMCIAARERLLHRLLLPLHQCTCTYQLYEETSFLRDPQLLRDLINVLAALADFDIVLEDSLTRGIDG